MRTKVFIAALMSALFICAYAQDSISPPFGGVAAEISTPNGQPGSTTARSEKTSAEHIRLALSAEELDVILATMIN